MRKGKKPFGLEEHRRSFFSKVAMPAGPDGCWLWTAAKNRKGYGAFGWFGKVIRATHASLRLHGYEEPPLGMMVCHHCDVPECVNPKHLFYGTPKDNTQDARRKQRFNYVNAKLSRSAVLGIFRAPGTQQDIADRYGVTQSVVSYIKTGKCYGYITGISRRRGPVLKITEEQVKAIRDDPRAQRAIAAEYGLSHTMVGAIKRGIVRRER